MAHATETASNATINNLPGNFIGNFSGFYKQPTTFPTKAEKVIRTQDFEGLLVSPKDENTHYPLTGKHVMDTSTTSNGHVIPTTGALLNPTAEWTGKGHSPLVVVAPGTLGQGPQCAASKSIGSLLAFRSSLDKRQNQGEQVLSMIANYESFAVLKLLAAGYKVFIVDYLGGSTGPQACVNNIEAGHVMLDAARTAVDMGATTAHTPVGFWGYSQGGAASALGATLHSSYAPDVNLKGAYAGAPPLDLIQVNHTIDGTMITAGALMGLNGFASRFPDVAVHVDKIMNDKGKKILKRLTNECIADSVFSTAYTQTKDLMKDGRPLYQHMRDTPLMRWHMDQQLAAAHRAPTYQCSSFPIRTTTSSPTGKRKWLTRSGVTPERRPHLCATTTSPACLALA